MDSFQWSDFASKVADLISDLGSLVVDLVSFWNWFSA